jgi:hypothetical protein
MAASIGLEDKLRMPLDELIKQQQKSRGEQNRVAKAGGRNEKIGKSSQVRGWASSSCCNLGYHTACEYCLSPVERLIGILTELLKTARHNYSQASTLRFGRYTVKPCVCDFADVVDCFFLCVG